MSQFRVSVGGMLGLVALAAVWFASLRSASGLWLSAAATFTLAALLTALLGVFLRRGPARAFCLGFALFGGVYLVLVDWDWLGGPLGHDLTGWLGAVGESLLPPEPDPGFPPRLAHNGRVITQPPLFGSINEAARQREAKLGNFIEIGRMYSSLLFGLLGGRVALAMAARGVREVGDRRSGDDDPGAVARPG